MRAAVFQLLFLSLILGNTFAEEIPLGLSELLRQSRTLSPETQLKQLEARAKLRGAQVSYGRLLPELGVEGGGRSSREKEKRNDHFYYGYARYELSLQEIYELKAALAKRRLAEREQELIRSEVDRLIAEHFFEAAVLQEKIKLKEEDFKLSEQQMQTARRRIEGGLATNTDLLEFQLHQQEIKNDLELLRQEWAAHLRELQRVSGLSSLPSSLDPLFPLPPPTLESEENIWATITTKNFELSAARAEAEVASAERGASFGGWLPRLSVEGQYGKLMETDFVESRKDSWEVVGKVTIPLFSGTSTLRDYQSKSAEAQRAQLRYTQEELKMRNALKSILDLINRLKAKFEGEQANVGTAEAYYKAVISEYRRGVKNSPDVASATDKLFGAKERLFETRRELSAVYLELLTLQGRTLED